MLAGCLPASYTAVTMPGKNLLRQDVEHSYYHVYNRGVNKQAIYLDEQDYVVFLGLLKRYLDAEPQKDKSGRLYPWLAEEVELLAYCLMPNHFHLFIYQVAPGRLMQLLKGVCTSYTMYFNRKYKRVGPLFQNNYRAVLVDNDSYLQHISRYIHLNPKNYRQWEFSSLAYYVGKRTAAWVRPQRVLEMFESDAYGTFVADYEDHKRMLEDLKPHLADR